MKTLIEKTSDKLVKAFLRNKIISPIPSKFSKKLSEAQKLRKLCESKIKEPVIGFKAAGTGIPLIKKFKEKEPFYASVYKRNVLRSGKKVKINKFNDSYRDFIHIDDVSKIYEKFLKNKKKFIIADIGTGKVTSINKLIKRYVTKDKKIISNIKKKNEISHSKANTTVLKKIMNKYKYTNINDFLNENL